MRATLAICVVLFSISLATTASGSTENIKFQAQSAHSLSDARFPVDAPKPFSLRMKSKRKGPDANNAIESDPTGDTFSLAPLLQDSQYYYFMNSSEQVTNHQFDASWETIGGNKYGTPGGNLLVIEDIVDLGSGSKRIRVQVTAANSQNEPEPWVDVGNAGSGLTVWRLDIGSDAGGNNPIQPNTQFEVTASGVSLYDSNGVDLGTLDINDTSSVSGLSGTVLVNLDNSADIAGYDLATMIMYWDIKVDLPAPPAQVDASDGTYADKIAVTWSAVSAATAYNVYYSSSVDSSQSLLGQYTGTSVNATGSAPGVVWYFWVYSVNVNGESATGTYDSGYVQATPADLAITELDAFDGTYAPGDELIVSNRTENMGDIDSEAYRITFYASSDTTITTNDHSIGFIDRTALGGGEVHHFDTTLGAPFNSLQDGSYYIGAILSSNDANNTNNSKHDPTPITVNSSAFRVSSGQSGAWYDPTHNGEGYFLQILSDSQAVVFWFSYDKEGNQFWMIGIGDINGSRISFPELQSPYGGKFGPDFDPEDVEYPIWGTLDFDFSDCKTATASYSGPPEFGSGTFNLTRLTSLWGLDCEGNDSYPQSTGYGFLNGGFSGSWFDISHNGEGFVVEVLNETTAVVIWFTYDTEGNPAWMLGSGVIDGASILVNEFQITSGGVFGPGFNPADVVYEPWGPAAYTFGSCGSSSADGNMRYIPPPDFGFEGNQFLNRLVAIHGLECGFLTDTYDVLGTMNVAENIFLDGDVNDPNVPEVSNDLDAESAQQLVPPAKVAGFVTVVPTENEGDRFAVEVDEWDVYVLAIREGESISLNVSDWDASDRGSNDLDLYLYNVNDPQTTVDSSLGTNQTEWVTAPEDGNYFVLVNAYNGTSNYLLRSGQSTPQAEEKLSASVKMETGELMAALRIQDTTSAYADNQRVYKSRVEKLEKENTLIRLEEGGNGEILYSVNSNRIDHLVPHPLTVAGRGSISPEDWQVIRASKMLSASKDFRWAGPNYIQYQMASPNDPGYEYQWHYPLIKLPQAWDITTGSSDIVVAVIDSGVYDHPDLANNVDYPLGYDFVASTLNSGDGDGIDPDASDPGKSYPSYADYKSHGTHVAGTVGATGNNGLGVTGVNWDVTIMPVRVCGVETCACWDITEGMKWSGRLANSSGTLPEKDADVLNLSLGGSVACPGSQEIVNQLVSKGVVIIAASGNENNTIPNYPASLNNVISVSATTFTDELAPYSSYGSFVDVAAPGGDSSEDLNSDGYADGVLSTLMFVEKGTSVRSNDYGFLQGTSMASPHIAGIAALMKSVYPEMGSNAFFTAISSGEITVDLAQNGATNKDPHFGYGRIDVQKAVNWAFEQSQGSPGDAFLTSSISAANFGSNQLSTNFIVSKGGEGALSVTDGGDNQTWIQLYSVSIDGDGFGTYRITVDRTGLIDGSYTGWVGIDGSDGSRIWISVTMQVGEKVAGEAGYLYALLLDSWTLGNVKQWNGLAINGDYSLSLDSNPPGIYFLMVGSDIDNDFTVCDSGEFCQIYPLNSQASEISVSDGDVQLGNFSMGFPENVDNDGVSSAAFEPEIQSDGAYIQIIKERIGTSGVSRKR